MASWLKRLFGDHRPDGFDGELEPGEHVLAAAPVTSGGFLVVTALGLWLPGPRRVGWHLISKAAWADGVMTITEAEEAGHAGGAVLLTDREPIRFEAPEAGKLPRAVRFRVDGSIRGRHRQELPGGGGAWFIRRKVPGTDGVVLQVRPDPGVDVELVERIAADAAAKLAEETF